MSSIVLQFENLVPGVTEIQLPFEGLTGLMSLTASHGESLTWTDDYPNNPVFISDVSFTVITVTGTFMNFGVNNKFEPNKRWKGYLNLTYVLDWSSDGAWTGLRNAFSECLHLVDVPPFLPSSIVDIAYLCNMIGPYLRELLFIYIDAVGNLTSFPPYVYPLLLSAFQGKGITTWNTSLVEDMTGAFGGCNQMDVSLASWSIASLRKYDGGSIGVFSNLENMLDLTALSPTHFEETLQGWFDNGFSDDERVWKYGFRLGAAGLSTTTWSGTLIKNKLFNKYSFQVLTSTSKYHSLSYPVTVEYGHKYFTTIVSRNIAGVSTINPRVTALIELIAAKADPPSDLSLSFVPKKTSVHLSWLPPADLHGSTFVSYLLHISPPDMSLSLVSTYYDMSLNYNTTYSFQVATVSQITTTTTTGGGGMGMGGGGIPMGGGLSTTGKQTQDMGGGGGGTTTTTTTYTSDFTTPPLVFQLPLYQMDPPSQVVVEALSLQQVQVSWSAPVMTYGNTIEGYVVQIQNQKTADLPLFLTTTATVLNVDGLLTNVAYTFSVQALAASHTENNSNFTLPVGFTNIELIQYVTPKRTDTYANISTALRYSQYVQQFTVSSTQANLSPGSS